MTDTQTDSYQRVFNFSAGPANLPVPVLEKVRDELLNYRGPGAGPGCGMSVLEMSHRSKEFDEILANATRLTRELLGVTADQEVLFLQGGASLQFAMAPMNFFQAGRPVDVVHTGYWTEMALKELKKGFESRVVYTGEAEKFTRIPELRSEQFHPDASYVYLCSNNTIEGTQLQDLPKTAAPLVADMSSDFLSRPLDMSRFGLVFAGAQKNLGPSGLVVAVISKELAERAPQGLPTMLQYRTHIQAGSRYNTPPAFSIYVAGLVLEWIRDHGGLAGMAEHNERKARVLYDAIDRGQGFYTCPVEKSVRSRMNVVWRVTPGGAPSEALEAGLIAEARKAEIIEIKGHRAVGGLRASIYNAMPIAGVERLASLLDDFRRRRG
jgi:phosphoserine aminotransferase